MTNTVSPLRQPERRENFEPIKDAGRAGNHSLPCAILPGMRVFIAD